MGKGIKTNKIDAVFSKVTRYMWDWKCAKCGKQYQPGSQGLHASHLWSRRHRSTRWCFNNVVAHCFACHQYLGGNPVEFAEWIEGFLGDGTDAMRLRANSTAKWSKDELDELYDGLKAWLKELEEDYATKII